MRCGWQQCLHPRWCQAGQPARPPRALRLLLVIPSAQLNSAAHSRTNSTASHLAEQYRRIAVHLRIAMTSQPPDCSNQFSFFLHCFISKYAPSAVNLFLDVWKICTSTLRFTLTSILLHRTWQNNHQTAVINLAVISFHQPSTSFSLCEKLFENWLRLLIISRAINLVHTEDRSIGAVIGSWSWISLRASCHFEGRAHNNSNLGRFWLLHGLARNHCWSLSLYPWKLIWTLLLRAAEKGNSS